MKSKSILLIILTICFFFIILQKSVESTENNVVYLKDFLRNEDYEEILSLDKDKTNFVFENFRYARPLKDDFVYNIFYDKKYMDQIKYTLNTEIYRPEFPIEHRIYSKESPGMQWHKDLLMYDKPQFEAIFTIHNNTESFTQWKDSNGKIHKVWTEPNSLLIVKAKGYEHNVTPIINGEREILKLIYTQSHKTNDDYDKEMKRFIKFKL